MASTDRHQSNEAATRWRAAMQEVNYLEDRVAIRLGDDHPAHRALVVWIGTLEPQRLFALGYERGQLTQGLIAKQREGHAAFDPARRSYVDAARRLVGPRLA